MVRDLPPVGGPQSNPGTPPSRPEIAMYATLIQGQHPAVPRVSTYESVIHNPDFQPTTSGKTLGA